MSDHEEAETVPQEDNQETEELSAAKRKVILLPAPAGSSDTALLEEHREAGDSNELDGEKEPGLAEGSDSGTNDTANQSTREAPSTQPLPGENPPTEPSGTSPVSSAAPESRPAAQAPVGTEFSAPLATVAAARVSSTPRPATPTSEPPAPKTAEQAPAPSSRSAPPASATASPLGTRRSSTERSVPRFHQPGIQKLGILGGKGVGKSYLFQSMIYRTYSGLQSGALSHFLEKDSIRLFSAFQRQDPAKPENLPRFIKNYARWHRLPTTTLLEQKWYRLQLAYRTGMFGTVRSTLDVEFFDGSGEGFFEAPRDPESRDIWRDGYLDATVMVFCLPIWAAFPEFGLPLEDWEWRDRILEGFEQVVQNYTELRSLNRRTTPVRSILALTMADDRRSALKTLRDRWISPYMDSPETYLRHLRRGSGVARYLANARRISNALGREFSDCQDPLVSGIPAKLDFGAGRPWMIPVSAIEGSFLEGIEQTGGIEANTSRALRPVPVHVELPLLVTLCSHENALM